MTTNDPQRVDPSSSAAAAPTTAPAPRPDLEAPQPFVFSSVLGRGLALYARNFLPLTGITLAVLMPWLLVHAAAQANGDPQLQLLASLLSILCQPLATAATVCAVARVLLGKRIAIAASVRDVAPHAARVVGAAVLTGICIAVATLFCLVPGFFVMAILYVTMPALVVERLTVTNAMKRSGNLTAEHRWGVWALGMMPFVLNIVAGIVFTRGVIAVPLVMQTGLTALVGVLTAAVGGVLVTLAYVDLRAEVEPTFRGGAIDDALAPFRR